jgi:hypothetical protein
VRQQHSSGHLRLVFQRLGKRWHGVSGGWADLLECVSSPQADKRFP